MTEPTLISAQIELDRIFQESQERPAVIFKHSPRCSVSAHALGSYRGFVEGVPDDDLTLFTLLDVVGSRALSDDVAQRTGVRHESPQIIVLRSGRVVWSGSHWDASAESLEKALIQARD